MIGIYCIRNLVNGKRYIGSTYYLDRRKKGHFLSLRKGTHSNIILQQAFIKYEEQIFEFEILEFIIDVENLIFRENYWIAFYNSMKDGYNLVWAGAQNNDSKRKRISDSLKGKKFSYERKQNISFSAIGRQSRLKGIPRTEEVRNKISQSLRGRSISEEVRLARIGKSRTKSGITKQEQNKAWKELVTFHEKPT